MPSLKITAIIVIFNIKIEESITYQMIRRTQSDTDILIVDNSDIDNNNKEICQKNGIRYISMEGNKGVSKAYNTAIDCSQNSDIIVFLDDDTEVPEGFFDKVREEALNNKEIDIFVPIIKGQDGVIYSPNEYRFIRNKLISQPDQEISQDKFNAIASCMAVRMKVFEQYRFNEALFVDQVDQFFFFEQRKLHRSFKKLDVVVKQNFYQRGKELNPDDGWRRLRQRITDIFSQARLMGSKKYLLLSLIKCYGLGVQIGKKSKSVKVFLKAEVLSTKLLFTHK